jgi:hypothetical protein
VLAFHISIASDTDKHGKTKLGGLREVSHMAVMEGVEASINHGDRSGQGGEILEADNH